MTYVWSTQQSPSGHCICYRLTCQIETAETCAVQIKATTILPLKPNGVDGVVATVFWAYKFDCIVDTQAGGGAINSTHLVVFQEKTLQFSFSNTHVNIEREKR